MREPLRTQVIAGVGLLVMIASYAALFVITWFWVLPAKDLALIALVAVCMAGGFVSALIWSRCAHGVFPPETPWWERISPLDIPSVHRPDAAAGPEPRTEARHRR